MLRRPWCPVLIHVQKVQKQADTCPHYATRGLLFLGSPFWGHCGPADQTNEERISCVRRFSHTPASRGGGSLMSLGRGNLAHESAFEVLRSFCGILVLLGLLFECRAFRLWQCPPSLADLFERGRLALLLAAALAEGHAKQLVASSRNGRRV